MLLDSVYATEPVREYVLTALTKLHTRMQDTEQQKRIRSILAQYVESIDLETQKRALEYSVLLKRDSVRDAVLEVMPLPEKRSIVLETVGGETKDLRSTVSSGQNDLLLDTENTPAGNTAHSQQNAQDLLLDIFGGSNEPAPPACLLYTSDAADE